MIIFKTKPKHAVNHGSKKSKFCKLVNMAVADRQAALPFKLNEGPQCAMEKIYTTNLSNIHLQ